MKFGNVLKATSMELPEPFGQLFDTYKQLKVSLVAVNCMKDLSEE